MTLRALVALLFAAWGASELVLNWRRRARRAARGADGSAAAGQGAAVHDRGSYLVVIGTVAAAIALAFAAQCVTAARWPWPEEVSLVAALLLLLAGVAVRWHAVLTLGRFFSVVVAVQPGHRVVQAGLYRYIRHPSYLGVLLGLLGGALALHNALSLVALLLPVTLALVYRMRVEEAVLLEALGEDYRGYCRRTRRLVPGLY